MLKLIIYFFVKEKQKTSGDNLTEIQEFVLVGLKDLHSFRIPVFLIVFIVYVSTLAGNIFIMILISTSHQLQSPMYFYLGHLSVCDILISTNVAPNTFQVIIKGRCPISLNNCLTQLYFFGSFSIIECCLLTIMSYDRYLAICNPLIYTSVMNSKALHYLVLWPWMAGFSLSVITDVLVFKLEFCGSNIIDHFFCDLAPILELSCSDTSAVEMYVSLVVIFIVMVQLLFLATTYILIVISILGISTSTGRRKAFSTCSSHLTVVVIYYGSLITLYLAPSRGYSLNLNKTLSLFNTLITPYCNPIIYSLRNKEIRTAANKCLKKASFSI